MGRGVRSILYSDCGWFQWYTHWQNSSNRTVKWVHFIIYKLKSIKYILKLVSAINLLAKYAHISSVISPGFSLLEKTAKIWKRERWDRTVWSWAGEISMLSCFCIHAGYFSLAPGSVPWENHSNELHSF